MSTLRQDGYILLAYPRSDVKVLDLLYTSAAGKLDRMNSPLYELFLPQTIACPVVKKNAAMPSNVGTEELLDLSVDADLSLLHALIKLIPVNAAAKFSFDKQKKVNVHLNDPKSDTVSQIALDSYLQSATLNTSAADSIDKMKDGELYVITEIVKTKSFTVEDASNAQTGVHIEAGAKAIADVNAGLQNNSSNNSNMSYNGDAYLTFCVKASRILYDKTGLFTKKVVFRLKPDKDIILVLADEEFPAEKLSLPSQNNIAGF